MRLDRFTCLASLYLLVFLPGCSYFNSTRTVPLTIDIPEHWTTTSSFPQQEPVRPWLREFNEPQLESFVIEAFAKNPGIQSLLAMVDIAEEQTWLSWSLFWPQINAGIKASRAQRNNASGLSISSLRSNNFGFSLDFLWEIDLWYKLGNELEASEYEKSAALADLYAAQLSLAANIAKTWFDAITAKLQIQLAQKTSASLQNALDIIEQGYDRGLYQALDVRLARSSLLNAIGSQSNYLRSADNSERALEVLLGRYPAAVIDLPMRLPALSLTELPMSVPATILERRPDIIAAKQRFLAADQRLLKAKKNLLPTIQLSGNGGTNTRNLGDIFNPEFLVWNIAGNLTQPLFHGYQLFAERDQARARVKKIAAEYAQVVLQAFQQVETTLAAEQSLKQQQRLARDEAEEASEAGLLAETAYLSGLADVITLLEAQRRAYIAENKLLELTKQRLHNRINLYLALGGPVLTTTASTQCSLPNNCTNTLN